MKKYIILILLFLILSCKNFNKINLTFYYEDLDNAGLFLNKKIEAFHKNNPDIKINIFKKTKIEFLNEIKKNKNKIDFIRYPSSFLDEFVELKILKSLNDIFEKKIFDQFSSSALQSVTIKNKIWGLPDNFIDYPVLYYNKSIIKTPIKNTNELIKINNQLNYKKTNNFGLLINLKEPFFIYPWLNCFGVNLFKEDKTFDFNQKELIDALQFIFDLKYKYNIISKDLNRKELEGYILNNNISMIIDGDWSLNYYQKILGNNFGVSLIPTPVSSKTDNYIFVSTTCYSILKKTSKRKTKAIKLFLNFINSKETCEEWRKIGRMHTFQIPQNQNLTDPLFNEIINISQKSKSYPLNKDLNLINKVLRPQLIKLIDNKISPKFVVKNAQEYFNKINNNKE